MANQEQDIVDPSGGGLDPHVIDFHTDADTTTTAPVIGDALEWDGSNWVPKAKGSFTGKVVFGAPLSPAALTVNTNNYSPTGLESANVLKLSSTGNVDLTGLLAPSPVEGQFLIIRNIGSNNIIFKNQDANSLAVNRFDAGSNKTVQGGESVLAYYDTDDLRWAVVSTNL